MRITRVILENWGPYRGTHEIDIDVSQGAPLVVIWGGNGKGKTKFIDAMKWVFSGGESGFIKVGPYINMSAILEGQEFDTSVTIDFFQDESRYRVKRKIQVDPAHLPDPGDGALEARLLSMPDKTFVTLEKIGEAAYSPEQAKSVLRRLFPARLVSFYFFDAAELIDSFKTMSGSEGVYSSTLDIQNSVETAMGFKGYESYLESLKVLEEELVEKAERDVADRKKQAQLKEKKDTTEARLTSLENDMASVLAQRLRNNEELSELNKQLEGMGESLSQQKEKAELAGQINANKSEIDAIRGRIKDQFGSLWAAPYAAQIKQRQAELAEAKHAWEDWKRSIQVQEARVSATESEISNPRCPHCNRDMDAEHKAIAKGNLDREVAALSALRENTPPGAAMFDERVAKVYSSDIWNSSKDSQLARMVSDMRRLGELQIQVLNKRSQIAQIDVALGQVDRIDFLAVHEAILDKEKLERDLKTYIQDQQPKLESERASLVSLNKQLSNLATLGDGAARRRLLKVQKLIRELSFILAELKVRVRSEIEAESNRILKQLVGQGDQAFSLAISQEYNLSTNKFNPNNGFKQQLILAFLFAIPRVAKAPFPVIIDSPLQHMDIGNRDNFLSWCKTGLSQLVLLPHDAEMNIAEIPELFGQHLSRFYELRHDAETMSSSVRKLG